ncbi:hypothetical protein Q8W25_01070 [Shimia thalassica]|uniref:hypothetical protein n=1 Tax=Shimia thalassica TaxID=1715693 RepID=UPI002734FC36|nr:hypothetical protein [Shimia thalassica]MDP2492579.1 hypothetical protein [Shimia thalassica]
MASSNRFQWLTDKALNVSSSAISKVQENSYALADWSKVQFEEYLDSQKPLDDTNWFGRAAQACEQLSDCVVNESGWTNKAVSVASGKLAGAAVPVSFFSVAALAGTASTGTAIGSLSGAAFTSSALAWIGGGVAMGTLVVGGAAIAGAVAAPFAVKPLANKYFLGQTRKLDELSQAEKQLVDACSALAIGLRQAEKGELKLTAKEAAALNEDALAPLVEKASEVLLVSQDWPIMQRRWYRNAFTELSFVRGFAKQTSSLNEPLMVGVGSALIFNLLSDGPHEFTLAEQDILDAIRRSSNELSEMTNEEIAEHVQTFSPAQLQGFKNNVKGIAHELQFARAENNDGDEFRVELFEATNHPGADVQIINMETGEIREFQLKATSYGAYVEAHFEKYEDTPVMTTSEVAEEHGFASTEISNEQLSRDFDSTTEKLSSDAEPEILDTVAFAGIVSLARNVRVLLSGEAMSEEARKAAVKRSMQAGLIAGLTELII